MSIKVFILFSAAGFFTVYAWRDWFKSLCGLIVMMAAMESGVMPRNIMGIQGLNPWNLMLVSVTLAWLANRRRERNTWDMPGHMTLLLAAYLGVIIVGFVRAFFDAELLGISLGTLISDELVNTLKWLMPAFLLYDGCRSEARLKLALAAILLLLLLIALQVYRVSPLAAMFNAEKLHEARLKFDRRVGYNAVDVAAMMAGAFWGAIAFAAASHKRRQLLAGFAVAILMLGALALSGGRGGFVAWAAVGLTLCCLRWRKQLLLAPVAPLLLAVAFPGAFERSLRGFDEVDPSGRRVVAMEQATSGRSMIWPAVIDRINRSPMIGYGRHGMMRTKLTHYFLDELGERDAVSHPHNVYLEWALDNGIIGLLPVLTFFGFVVYYSARLFRSPRPWAMAAGGLGLALTLSQLIAGLGSQHFYPTEGNFAVWCSIALALRVNTSLSRNERFGKTS